MASKKARAKAAKIEAAKSAPAVTYKVKIVCDAKHSGAVCLNWTHVVLVSADGYLDAEGNHTPQNLKRTVGAITSRIICRDTIRRTFWESMQEPGQKTSALAFALFDRLVICSMVLIECSAVEAIEQLHLETTFISHHQTAS